MKAAIVKTLGAPPVFGQFSEPMPLPGEAVINVVAAGIKQLDRHRAGTHYSTTLPSSGDLMVSVIWMDLCLLCLISPTIWGDGRARLQPLGLFQYHPKLMMLQQRH